MMKHAKIPCPGCGAPMNRHAEKVDYAAGLSHPDAVDPALGGVLEEIHLCPACGETVARRQ
jgi:predicted RNA-binding Zn-ribbon protein involved in translation (DUF1610 family)